MSQPLQKEDFKGATISDCGKYRFQLWRVWDFSLPKVLWIMHNPSTADADNDDPTIRRIIGFSKSWGYGGLYVGNLYPFRATNPKDLLYKSIEEVCPPFINWRHINEMVRKCQLHVLAYGNPIIAGTEPELFDKHWHFLKLTKAGNPCHPLYLKGDLKPQPINQ